jgi:hypothetical protein
MPDSAVPASLLDECIARYPYPIAAACRKLRETIFQDAWEEWEVLSRDVLQAVLKYCAHLLLSDLAAAEQRPPLLYHRIQSILSRPMAGHYVGFLRETALHYRREGVRSAVPELIAFVLASEVEGEEQLLAQLVSYRNVWAHGRVDDEAVIGKSLDHIRRLTAELLERLRFLADYRLVVGDASPLMGASPEELGEREDLTAAVVVGETVVRPLLLKLAGTDLVMLEDADLQGGRLVYRGHSTYRRFTKKQLNAGEPSRILDDLRALLRRVRAETALLPRPDWETFRERSAVVTDRTLSSYQDIGKYNADTYISRPQWDGDDGVLDRFLSSDRGVLAVAAEQGCGKSALMAHLADRARSAEHAVLFLNAQRLTYADPAADDPVAVYLADLLHFEGGLGGDSMRRLTKAAPQGERVVFLFDAVNEVDGLSPRWNRFRVMEKLLEWARRVADAGGKVILTFRANAYLPYGYLVPEELPEGLGTLAWGQEGLTHPELPWAVRLGDFTEDQARAYFECQRARPRGGMAPEMTWEHVREALGERLAYYVSNPLLLGIFLRCHHGRRTLLAVEPEDLFQRYADRLTGAASQADRPLLTRAWGWLRTGNITTKERFLADVMSKMASSGGAAFLQEDLDPGVKRDRRLLSVMEDADETALDDLKEGGLLAVEHIETVEGDRQILSRRISFVAELASAVMSGVERKAWYADRKVAAVGSVAQMAMAFAACWVILLLGRNFLFANSLPREFVLAFGDPRAGLFDMVAFTVASVMVLVASILTAKDVLVLLSCPSGRALSAWDDPLARGTLQSMSRDVDRTMWATIQRAAIVILPVALGSGALSVAHLGEPDTALLLFAAALWALLAFVGCLLSWIAIPPLGARFMRLGLEPYPPRMIRTVSRLVLEHGSPDLARSDRREILDRLAILGIGLIVATAFVVSQPAAPPVQPAWSTGAFYAQSMQTLANFQIEWARAWLPLTLYGLAVGAPALMLLSSGFWLRFAMVPRFHRGLLADPVLGDNARARRLLGRVVVAFAVVPAIALSAYGWSLRNPAGDFSALAPKVREIRRDESEQVTGLVVTSDLGEDELEALYALPALRELVLAPQVRTPLDVSKLPALRVLSAHRDAIGSLEGAGLYRLVILDSDGTWDFARGNSVKRLRLEGDAPRLGSLSQAFPALVGLELDETVVAGLGDELPHWSLNAKLTVHCAQPTRLDWLSPHHELFILRIAGEIDDGARHLDRLQRLEIDAGAIAPATLARAENLRWLVVRFHEGADPDWLREVAGVLENLEALEYLDVVGRPSSEQIAALRTAVPKVLVLDHIGVRRDEANLGVDAETGPALLRALAANVAEANSSGS